MRPHEDDGLEIRDDEKDEGQEDDERRDSGDDRRPRREKSAYQRSEDERWAESLNWRLRPLLDPDVDVLDYGGRDAEE